MNDVVYHSRQLPGDAEPRLWRWSTPATTTTPIIVGRDAEIAWDAAAEPTQ
jgi:hypothetical protein